MKKTFIMTIALLCVVLQGAWADGSSFGGGDGSAKNPYIISTAAHWNQFASDVNGGNAYSDTYFLLDADITVTTMVGAGTTGNNAKPFSGTFDGGGHMLTFNHTATEEEGDIAPFRFIKNALICNLHVAGEINTAYRHAGGLAGRTYGTTRIEGCRVSTVIKSSVGGDGTHGGIVALKPDWSNAHLTIEGCVFDGKIITTNGTTHCGGFVGYTSYGSLTIKNSIYAPATTATGEEAVNSQYTFYRYNDKHPGTITLTNCYYTQLLGGAQGKQAHSIGFPAFADITVVPTGNVTEYGASGIIGYADNHCVKYNGKVYAGYEDVVRLKFSHNYADCTVHYKVDQNELPGNDTDGYTLNMPDEDVIIEFSMTGPALPGFDGDGSAAHPYEIYHSVIWDYIVGAISREEVDYATAYYKLTEDIEVTSMMGSESHRFKGHFDGGGHTLTVNYDSNEPYTAPFRYVEGAEISNLHVAGTITTGRQFAAGFVANAKGDNTMTNCRSSVTINSNVYGDGTHGGFVSINTGGRFKMEGCVFDGKLLGTDTGNCGGFVGWNETNGSPGGVVEFRNCLFAPTSVTVGIDHTYARSRVNDGGHVQMYYSNCRTNFGDNQQFCVYSISAGDSVTIEVNQTALYTYDVSDIIIYNKGMMCDGVIYARNEQDMSLNLGYTSTVVPSGFATTAGTLSGSDNPFTFTMSKADAVINAIYSGDASEWTHGGAGTPSNPYIISNSDEWNEFASKVNNGIYGFSTAYYKLADNITDITVTTMVGTDGHKFKGHFDGNGKTLILSYGTEDEPFGEDYCAPFRYIEGADIQKLTVGGTIYTKNMFAAGIAGFALNKNTFTDCRCSVTINSCVSGDGTHGGFVANCQNNDEAGNDRYVTFTRCAFDGKLLGMDTDNCGGFVGWTEGSDFAGVTFSNCIFAPSEVSIKNDGSANFSRGRGSNWYGITLNDSCYYTKNLGTLQGDRAYTSKPANITTVDVTIAGVTVYVKKSLVTNVTATYITPNTATIGWTGSSESSNYQVRYRVNQNTNLYSTDFEGGMPEDWTMFSNDDDDYNWTYDDGTKKGMTHDGTGCIYSASYVNGYGAMNPDNWLVSPRLTLGGTMQAWLKGQDADCYSEHFAIYLSLTGNSKSDFVDASGNLLSSVITLVPETETTNVYQEYTADLSDYNGQYGYIAIRHFNCYDQFYLVLDDFSIYNDEAGGEWTTVLASTSETANLTELEPGTDYEYQVGYEYDGTIFYTSTATLTTLNDNMAPIDLSATAITANTATISWTGYGESYNLRYGQGGGAKVTLKVPNDFWDDGSGYQMLLDEDHDTYGTVIPVQGGLTTSGDATDQYAHFEYKIPTNADGRLDTDNKVDGINVTEVSLVIPAGTYDWCITNPSPNDRVWIASEQGNVGGRQDDFVFEAGKHYTFTVTFNEDSSNDCVNMTVIDDTSLDQGEVTTITGITTTSYTLSGLTASTDYTIYVQSVKGEETSEWSSMLFTTADSTKIGLMDYADNSEIIAANIGEQRNVTLVGRTLYKDGDWNTLCLPFSVAFEGSLLEDATVMELDPSPGNYDHATGFEGGTLYLNFVVANQIEAGHAYIVKWEDEDAPIKNPVFNDVTVMNVSPADQAVVSQDGYVSFVGTYSPINIYTAEKTNLYLGSNNTLYYPTTNVTIGALRAYFQLHNGLVCGEPNTPGSINAFVLNFGDETGSNKIKDERLKMNDEAGAWYDLSGRKLSGKPTAKGIYINNGRKVVVE